MGEGHEAFRDEQCHQFWMIKSSTRAAKISHSGKIYLYILMTD